MKHQKKSKIISAIDIGTTKICVLIARFYEEQNQADDQNSSLSKPTQFEIIGIGITPSEGLERGVVVDIMLAAQSIKKAIKEAEQMAKQIVEEAYVGISGTNIQSNNSHGIISLKHREIRESDIALVIETAKAIPLIDGQQILHAIPQYFIIDKEHRVRDPLGMYGVRLEALVHIITGSVTSVQNIIRCCALAGVIVKDIVLEPLASAASVLSDDERELGVGILDIGGGTSDFAVYFQNGIRHTKIFPIAGNLFTNDIAICLKTPIKIAEEMKITLAVSSMKNSTFTLLQHTVPAIIAERTKELFSMVAYEIEQYSLHTIMHTGLVITGGGALLSGITEQAHACVNMPVRIGLPCLPQFINTPLHTPIHATGCGIIAYISNPKKSTQHLELTKIHILERMKRWMLDFF